MVYSDLVIDVVHMRMPHLQMHLIAVSSYQRGLLDVWLSMCPML